MIDAIARIRDAGDALFSHIPWTTDDTIGSSTADVLKGAVAGAVGGCAATWFMTEAWMAVSKALPHGDVDGDPARAEEPKERRGRGTASFLHEEETATVKTAEVISQAVLDHDMDQTEKEIAGPVVHYAFGAAAGALYGGLAERYPSVTLGQGTAFGTAVWFLGDEVAVPAFGLTAPPHEHSPPQHINAFVAHLVYGLATEGIRRLIRRAL